MTALDNIIPLPAPEKQPDKRWSKGKYANLRKYLPTGTYHCHATVNGRLIRKSLQTKSETIAKVKLDRLLEKERKRLAKKANGDMDFKALADEYISRIDANPDLKPGSKRYRKETLAMVRAVWPEIDDEQSQKIEEQDVVQLAGKLRAKYSATRYNGTLETLRAIFQLGIELGIVADNPVVFTNKRKGVKGIARAKTVPKDWKLPDPDEFDTLLARLAALPSRLKSFRTVRFLTFSGLRIGAARKVMPKDVDLKGNYLTKPPIKYSDAPKRLPMFKELRKVCEELLADYPGDGPLLPIANPRKALKNSCIECGIQPLTNQGLRHLFTTRCLESGIDVPTVAEWRGDKDGGAMLLTVYAHVIDSHGQRMARKVKF